METEEKESSKMTAMIGLNRTMQYGNFIIIKYIYDKEKV